MSLETRSYLFAGAAVLMWSTVATAFKLALAALDLFQLLFIAVLVSVIVLLGVLASMGRLGELLPVFRSHWRFTLVAGLLNPCLYYIILFEAYDRLPAQVAQPINYTWAIVLAFLSMLVLKQRIRAIDFVAGGICYLGVFVIATQGSLAGLMDADWIGLALAILSTLVWAIYWVANIRDTRESIVGMALNFLVALPVVTVMLTLFSTWHFDATGIPAAVWVGAFEMSLAFVCWSMALRSNDNAAKIGNLIFLSPFLSLIFISQILGEQIHMTTYAGLVLIVGGLILQQRWQARSPPGSPHV